MGTLVAADDAQNGDWPMFGQNPANTASTGEGSGLSVKTAPSLKKKWTFTTGGDVSARAAVQLAYLPMTTRIRSSPWTCTPARSNGPRV